MGTSAKAAVTVQFETNKQAERYQKILKKFNKNILNYYKANIDAECKDVDADVYDLTRNGDVIEFNLYSNRSQNLDWQQEYAIHFAKEVGGIKQFNSDVWVMGDSLYIGCQEDVDNYTPHLK